MRENDRLDPEIVAAISSAVEDQTDGLLELARALIACRTDSQSEANPDFVTEAQRCQDLVAAYLADLGAELHRWEEPPFYAVVAGKLPGLMGGRSLAFNGHVDVVPAGAADSWTRDPWAGEIDAGRLWGRGAADMKGGVTCALVAMRALQVAGISLEGDVWAHIVSDEEVVGQSTRHLLRRLPAPDAVIVAEPTDLAIMPIEGGLVHLRIEVDGRESHAGNRYMTVHAGGHGQHAGVNAIEKMLRIVAALQDLERQWGNLRHHPMLPAGFNSLMPGIIVGGPGGGADGKLNVISNPGTSPNYCSIEYNVWFLPGETFEAIHDEIESFIRQVCELDPWLREHPPRLTWKLRNIYFPPAETAPDHPFIRCVSSALEATDRNHTIQAFTAASELAWYAEAGVPGTIFGPGSVAQAHGPDEYVSVDKLQVACRTMALTAAAWCGISP